MTLAHFQAELSKLTRGEIKFNEPMARYTSMNVGGAADCLCVPESEDEVVRLIRFGRDHALALTVLGHGSNILVSDRGIRGIALKLEHALGYLTIDDTLASAGAGVPLSRLVRETLDAGLVGLECLVGIPGSVGGAVFMNAGTRYGSIATYIESARVYELESDNLRVLAREELDFGYRYSVIQEGGRLVTGARLRLQKGDPAPAREIIRELQRRRATSQPLAWPNAGSVFRNPEGDYAGRLIEQVGLKGLRRGHAQVSERHANFIVNVGGATASDVFELILEVQQRVFDRWGIQLQTEIRPVGDWSVELGSPHVGALVAP